MTREIEKLRVEIDSIDREMIKLFEARMDVSREVGAYKRERGLPVYDAARERQVILSRIDQVKEPEYREYAEMLMRAIMDYSKKIQRSAPLPCRPEVAGRIAYQGAPGAYGQEAARRYFPRGELIAQSSFEDVFGAVSAGQVEYGVVPVENSVAGSVAENWDLLGRYGLFVVGEIILKIDHVLLGTQDSDLAHIKKVYSHPQALSQCNGFLSRNKEFKKIPYENTALAAKMVSEAGDRGIGAIASRYAGELYGLKILKEAVADSLANQTRFFVLTAGSWREERPDKATMVFTLSHKPGALAGALTALYECGLNLMRIESRPIPGRNWQYTFYIDLEGNLSGLDAPPDKLLKCCQDARLLGKYRRAES